MSAIRSILLALALTAIGAGSSWAQGTNRESDEKAIRAVFTEMEAAVAARKPERVVALHAPDSDIWMSGGDVISGRDGLLRNEQEFEAKSGLRNYRVASIGKIRFLGADAAIVNIEEVATIAGKEEQAGSTVIFTRREGRWLIAGVRLMRFSPPAKAGAK
jgi:uncharacterized protein (TIGR02246 family)